MLETANAPDDLKISWYCHEQQNIFCCGGRPTATLRNKLRVPNPEGHKGTGKAFGGWISKCLLDGAKKNLAIVSADLAVSCGISEVLEHPRCYEMGVAEQNAIAFASGLAATGMLPVVATYSAFFKRAYEQIYIAQVSGFRMVYAGSYSGLCYHTDGKSHTS